MCGGGVAEKDVNMDWDPFPVAGTDDEYAPVKYDIGAGDEPVPGCKKDIEWSDCGPARGAVARRLYRRRLQKK